MGSIRIHIGRSGLWCVFFLFPLVSTSFAVNPEIAAEVDNCVGLGKLGRREGDVVYSLKQRYQEAEFSTESENKKFLELDENGLVYIHVENSVLKTLNDKVLLDRELSQATENLYKALVLENLRDHPEIAKLAESGIFTDYKGIRLALRGDIDVIEKALGEVLTKTASQFQTELAGYLGKDFVPDEFQNRLAKDPRLWHQAGIGRTADQAAWSAKNSRKQAAEAGQPTVTRFDRNKAVKDFETRFSNAESRRDMLERKLGKHSDILSDVAGTSKKVLTEEAIDILRHADVADMKSALAYIKDRFKNRFSVEISDADAYLLVQYLGDVDAFVPNINITRHDSIALGIAENGFMAVDIAGQNARNLRMAMEALAEFPPPKKDLSIADLEVHANQLLGKLREGQDKASAEFEKIKIIVDHSVAGIRGDPTFSRNNGLIASGDDIAFAPKEKLTPFEKQQILKQLAKRGTPSHYRVSFIPEAYLKQPGHEGVDLIREGDRGGLVVVADSVEKALRTNLEGRIPHSRLKKILFAMDLRAHSPTHIELKLLMEGPTEGVDKADLAIIREEFKTTLAEQAKEQKLTLHEAQEGSRDPQSLPTRLRPRGPDNVVEIESVSKQRGRFPWIPTAPRLPLPLTG